jgi:hypothetical protein
VPEIDVEKIGKVSCDQAALDVASRQLEHQLDRYRDVLSLSLGLLGVSVGGIAFLLVEKSSGLDDVLAVIFIVGGVFAAVALLFRLDAQDAPKAQLFANVYESNPDETRGLATAAILIAIDGNARNLKWKMRWAKLALLAVLIGTACSVPVKIVELRGHVDQRVDCRASEQDKQGTIAERGRGRGYNCLR